MTVEKFVDADSIDPIYYDASYYVAPDGKGSDDVYAVLREAITRTGKVALTRVVISQRERTIALRPLAGGMVAQTLNEERDLNSYAELFEHVDRVKIDEEMVKLCRPSVQLLPQPRHRQLGINHRPQPRLVAIFQIGRIVATTLPLNQLHGSRGDTVKGYEFQKNRYLLLDDEDFEGVQSGFPRWSPRPG